MEIQLYIANKLCDLGSSDLAVTLKRQFLNPEALNTKDAQKSYSVTIPATPTNNNIFSYVNVEEVGNKFKIYDNARLYVGGVLIFNGKFRLAEITRDGYRGHLGVPKAISISDIFGETKMSEAGTWFIDFTDFVSDAEKLNNESRPPCIFPLVLYGLLEKAPENGVYTAKDLIDETVLTTKDDFLPSVNCLQMIKKIFESHTPKYEINGTAFNDEKLSKLYMSYQNQNAYQPSWGSIDRIKVTGNWINYDGNKNNGSRMERNIFANSQLICTSNILGGYNTALSEKEDAGKNIIERQDVNDFLDRSINVPVSGYYKIQLKANVKLDNTPVGDNWYYTEIIKDRQWAVVPASPTESFPTLVEEIKLLRNWDVKDLTLNNTKIDCAFYNTNFPDNGTANDGNYPKFFPEAGKTNFIDVENNANILCGLSFIRYTDATRNPTDTENKLAYAMSIKGGYPHKSADVFVKSVSDSDGYLSYDEETTERTDRQKVELTNVPIPNYCERVDSYNGNGNVSQIVWLEKGERLYLVSTAFGLRVTNDGTIVPYSWVKQKIEYTLEIAPFKKDNDWLELKSGGETIDPVNWEDQSDFSDGQLNLMEFLPSDKKVDEWLDHFCKAFNLIIENTGASNFELNIKNKRIVTNTSRIIDIDSKANLAHRNNQPLDLPYMYRLGFTIDESEEGYVKSKFDGGGTFYTQVTRDMSSDVIDQKSNFSYTWFKRMRYDIDGHQTEYDIPVITDTDIWEDIVTDYEELIDKRYYDKAQRFWYKKDGSVKIPLSESDTYFNAALVTGEINNSILDYENKKDSLMRNYFLLFTNEKHYTIIECYLTPEEYSLLDIALVRFNGDLYNVAEIDGYDPLGKRKSTLKLIRKI